MSVTPGDFIQIADELMLDNSPINIRTAACRGYYGAYHAARIFHGALPTPGMLTSGGGVHEELIQRLENPTLSRSDDRYMRSKSLGMLLRRIRTIRTHADYKLNEPLSREMAADSIEEARRLIEKSSA